MSSALGESDEVVPPGGVLPVTMAAPALSSRRCSVLTSSAHGVARAGVAAASARAATAKRNIIEAFLHGSGPGGPEHLPLETQRAPARSRDRRPHGPMKRRGRPAGPETARGARIAVAGSQYFRMIGSGDIGTGSAPKA